MKTFKKIVSVALVATMFLGVSQLPMSVAAATQDSTTATEQATVQTESKQSNTVELNSVVEDTTQSEPATAAATTAADHTEVCCSSNSQSIQNSFC